MPYRRLPNTDKARLRALNAAFRKGKETVPTRLPFSVRSLDKIEIALKTLSQINEDKNNSYKARIALNKKFQLQQQKTKLYISHFIQVFNMCILRNEIDKKERNFFGLDQNSAAVPDIQSTEDILNWGKAVTEGEKERIMKGGVRIYNPKPAIVEIEYKNFLELYQKKQIQDKIHFENSERMKAAREDIDALISDIWNQTESFFDVSNQPENRKECSLYGVVYVSRKKERRLQNLI